MLTQKLKSQICHISGFAPEDPELESVRSFATSGYIHLVVGGLGVKDNPLGAPKP